MIGQEVGLSVRYGSSAFILVIREDQGSSPPSVVSKCWHFRSLHIVSFESDSKSRRSFLPDVYVRGSERYHTGVNV